VGDDPAWNHARRADSVTGMCAFYALHTKDGKPGCSNRKNQVYLGGCNTFPEHPGQIADKPSCSYRFRWEG
jgi:hypothetical protein